MPLPRPPRSAALVLAVLCALGAGALARSSTPPARAQQAELAQRAPSAPARAAREQAASVRATPAPTRGALERARSAERAGLFNEAFAGYLEAWRDPALRQDAARHAHALARFPSFDLPDDPGAADLARSLGPGFRPLRTRSFLILSDADADWTRTRAALLERARDQYFREMDRLGVPVYPNPTRLTCVIFADRADYLAFARDRHGFDASWAAGYYADSSNLIAMYDDRASPAVARLYRQLDEHERRLEDLTRRADDARDQGQSQRADLYANAARDLRRRIARERERVERDVHRFSDAKAIHEAIHLLAFNTGLQRRHRPTPLWISEGLATGFETHTPQAAFGLAFDHNPRRRDLADALASDALPPLATLVALDGANTLHADDARPVYAAAYALVAELYRTNRAELGAYLRALADLPQRPMTPHDHRALFERHFGPIDQLERRLLRRWRADAHNAAAAG